MDNFFFLLISINATIFIFIVVRRIIVRRKNTLTYISKPFEEMEEGNKFQLNGIRSTLSDHQLWESYKRKFDAEVVEKRRQKFISTFNEVKTRQSVTQKIITPEGWSKFIRRVANVKINPYKVFKSLFLPFVLFLHLMASHKAHAQIKEGDVAYKNKDYDQAILLYSKDTTNTKVTTRASAYYKIGLSYNKLKNCSAAKGAYAKALTIDPVKAGASSMDKFEEKIRECGFTKENLNKNEGEPIEESKADLQEYTAKMELGNQAYNQKKYLEALDAYRQARLVAKQPKKLAIAYYKEGLCYLKVKNRGSAAYSFEMALQYDPEKGGASSQEKFVEKAGQVGVYPKGWNDSSNAFNEVDYDKALKEARRKKFNANDLGVIIIFTVIGQLFLLPLAIFIGKVIADGFSNKLHRKYIQQYRAEMDVLTQNEEFWNNLVTRGYPFKRIQQVRQLFTKASEKLRIDSHFSSIRDLYAHSVLMQQKPQEYFGPRAFESGFARFLIGYSEFDLYCFFTGEFLADTQSYVIEITHPDRPELNRKVFASGKVYRKIGKGAKLKVRLHEVEEQWVHWSEDVSYYSAFLPHFAQQKGNSKSISNWKGEVREIALDRYYEIFTGYFPNYVFPAPDSIVQATVPYLGKVPIEKKKTGFEPTEETGYSGTSLGDLATAMVITDMLTPDRVTSGSDVS